MELLEKATRHSEVRHETANECSAGRRGERRQLWIAVATLIAVCSVASASRAGTFVPSQSELSVWLGQFNPMAIEARPATEGSVSLSDDGFGGHVLAVEASVWSTVNFSAGTSLYTGLPVIDDLVFSLRNQAGSFTNSFSHTNFVGDNSVIGPYLGGEARLSGSLIVIVLWAPIVEIDLTDVGGPAGGYELWDLGGIPGALTAGPWVTGGIPITRITTNVISVNGATGVGITLRPPPGAQIRVLSTNGGFSSTGGGLPLEAHTVTLSGSNQLASASQSGAVTLVSPLRISGSASAASLLLPGWYPGAVSMTLHFVPEPGTTLLLLSGATGLVWLGRRRRHRPR